VEIAIKNILSSSEKKMDKQVCGLECSYATVTHDVTVNARAILELKRVKRWFKNEK
jgi:hypothetical protein